MPTTVGELRKLIADLDDNMPFNVDVKGLYGSVDDMWLDVSTMQVGWDGVKTCPILGDVLRLVVEITA